MIPYFIQRIIRKLKFWKRDIHRKIETARHDKLVRKIIKESGGKIREVGAVDIVRSGVDADGDIVVRYDGKWYRPYHIDRDLGTMYFVDLLRGILEPVQPEGEL